MIFQTYIIILWRWFGNQLKLSSNLLPYPKKQSILNILSNLYLTQPSSILKFFKIFSISIKEYFCPLMIPLSVVPISNIDKMVDAKSTPAYSSDLHFLGTKM